MAAYHTQLDPIPNHRLPPLLLDFARWLGQQEYGAIGYFDLQTEVVPGEWSPDSAERLRRDGFSFLQLPDGSLLVLLKTGPASPSAVVLLGSEGETNTVATSLEEFLVLLSQGRTGSQDLDDATATGRAALGSWLSEKHVRVPDAQPFDFDAYLDGESPEAALAAPSPAPSGEPAAGLPPLLRQIVTLMGRRADDPEVSDFVTGTLAAKGPGSTTDASGTKYVIARQLGVELAFNHDVKNEKYPLIRKSKNSYVPYLAVAWLREELPEPLPCGLKFGMSADEIAGLLGPPDTGPGATELPTWRHRLDAARELVLLVVRKKTTTDFSITIEQARELSSRHGVPARQIVGLFVAWAILRDLLDPTRFPEHEALIAAIRNRELQGSVLVDAALPRGLWDIHLRDTPGLRKFAHGWFRNIGGTYIRDDLVAVFGARQGPYGHAEPILDDDTWSAVDQAASTLDNRFAAWRRSVS